MPILTLAQIQDQVQNDLTDQALQKILDGESKRIEKAAGKETAVIETKFALGLKDIFTGRSVGTINSIKERRTPASDEVTLSADDYRVLGPHMIRRLAGGTNSAAWWGSETVINYDPVNNIELRNSVLVELIRIAIDAGLVKSQKDGDYAAVYRNPARARSEALATLNDSLGIA